MRFLIQTECIIGARLVQPLEGDSHGLARALAGMRLRLHCCTEPRGAVGRRQLPRQPAPRARARAWGGLRVAQAVRDAQGAVNRRHFEGGAGLGESLRARRGARLEPEQLRVGTLWTSWQDNFVQQTEEVIAEVQRLGRWTVTQIQLHISPYRADLDHPLNFKENLFWFVYGVSLKGRLIATTLTNIHVLFRKNEQRKASQLFINNCHL